MTERDALIHAVHELSEKNIRHGMRIAELEHQLGAVKGQAAWFAEILRLAVWHDDHPGDDVAELFDRARAAVTDWDSA